MIRIRFRCSILIMISKLIFCLRACIFVHAVAVMMEKECNELFLLLLICRLEEEKKKLKEKERQKGLHGGQKASRAHLANIRVVQPNLVYTVGLAMDICHEGILKEYEFFGQFGKMVKKWFSDPQESMGKKLSFDGSGASMAPCPGWEHFLTIF